MENKSLNNGITVNDDGSIMASGPDGVALYTFLATRRALSFEIRTGMSMHRGMSALQAAKMHGFVPDNIRSKAKALDYMNCIAVENGLERA